MISLLYVFLPRNPFNDVAEQTMLDATQELLDMKDSTDVGVSVDGAWQRRGYASFNGLVAAILIDSGKVLDVEAMSRYCKACREKEILISSNKEEYDRWYEIHKVDCTLNCVGSAGSMEVTGTNRSLITRKMRYTVLTTLGMVTVRVIYPSKTLILVLKSGS